MDCFDCADNVPKVLELESGEMFTGCQFGADKNISGELVFTTSMVGYPESLTDPSYKGQILVITYPLIGNYGVPSDDKDEFGLLKYFESSKIQIDALIISDLNNYNYHWNSHKSLDNWLKKNNIPGLYSVDTRSLTILLREKGTINARIYNSFNNINKSINHVIPEFNNQYENTNLVDMVSTKEIIELNKPIKSSNDDDTRFKIIVVDCGIKNSILRQLLKRNFYLKVVPHDYNFNNEEFDGLFLSNGPGNPEQCIELINNLQIFLSRNTAGNKVIPLFAICLGHQLLSLAIGGNTYKMKYGNRSLNQPCMDMRTGKSYITSQNHGYAVDSNSLPDDWKSLYINLNDLSNEGMIHKSLPYFSVQFHPEAKAGPPDTAFLFDLFLEKVKQPNYRELTTLEVHDLDKPMYKKVLILGSGGLSIGQAGEFDYSGSQAIKALKEENISTVLINPNIATVQTSWDMADKVYFLPVNIEFVEQVIIQERPDGILATFGGQTALNCLTKLVEAKILDKYDVKIMGTPVETIIATEDRGIFAEKMAEIGEPVAQSETANNIEEALKLVTNIGFPVIIRAAFALGGLGSGFAENMEEFKEKSFQAFQNSPQILIEKSMKGWKEIEYEVVRDRFDNCITVCNMENLDPLGIHTGDSIVVAPSQTLSDDEYYMLRNASIKIIKHLGVVGECNVQYALNPFSREYCVIEVNARLSRSSALASKATGYPLAYIAAKLSLGTALSDLKNSVTKKTTAFFEPSLDYIVVKIPRWDLNKFNGVSNEIGSSMKSVGEVMAIGKSFEETIHKATRMANDKAMGLYPLTDLNIDNDTLNKLDKEEIINSLKNPCNERLFNIFKAFSMGITFREVNKYTNIDLWFLDKLYNIYALGKSIENREYLNLDNTEMLMLKKYGYSDYQIAKLTNTNESNIRRFRLDLNIKPYVKQIDTTSGEFPAETNYLYMTYNAKHHDIINKNGVIVLGCGAYRIGSSVEFDWCAVSCINTLKKSKKYSIVINYNPETVSTDYDMCDRLYFEEISLERVLDIYQFEQSEGVIISVGGQVPNNIAMDLYDNQVKILGTSPKDIDRAEDRSKFSNLLDTLNIDQPEWCQLNTLEEAINFCNKVGYPALIRPSYVLSGAAMRVVKNNNQLISYLKYSNLSSDYPVVISKFIEKSKEIELDGVARDGEIVNYAISEHVENAGVHSGDATLILPAQKLYLETAKRIKKVSRLIASNLNISGPFNIQFLSKDNCIKVIECNLRASRSFPFVSKTYNVNFIEIATKIMCNQKFTPPPVNIYDMEYVCVKAPMFSFTRLPNADPVLGVEMASTGEVACFGEDIHDAYLKAMIAAGFKIPRKNILISIPSDMNRFELKESLNILQTMDYQIYCTPTTSDFLSKHDIVNTKLSYNDGEVFSYISNKTVDLVINIPRNGINLSENSTNGYRLRTTCINSGIPLITNVKSAMLLINSLKQYKKSGYTYKSWNEYVNLKKIR